eukprot:GFUD01061975.1.p1 GENE.GFUD01061975.1~~GFUD01061975.1.p1  ORF type:complete len:236 (+),score=57.48 GFUD01061975.1:54-761(+)
MKVLLSLVVILTVLSGITAQDSFEIKCGVEEFKEEVLKVMQENMNTVKEKMEVLEGEVQRKLDIIEGEMRTVQGDVLTVHEKVDTVERKVDELKHLLEQLVVQKVATTTTTTSTTTTTTTTTTDATTTTSPTSFVFVARATGTPSGVWTVKKGKVDAIDFTSSKTIQIEGISLLGSNKGPANHTGLIELKETSNKNVISSQYFIFHASGEPEYHDQRFSSAVSVLAGVKYTLTVE